MLGILTLLQQRTYELEKLAKERVALVQAGADDIDPIDKQLERYGVVALPVGKEADA